MKSTPIRCLILACGNTLRGDDGVGPWLAAWAEERFDSEPAVRVIWRQQWTPELAEDVARAEAVVFVDCAVDAAPGAISITPVQPASAEGALATHHVSAAELLALGQELYASKPAKALLLTIGAGSTELGETFSQTMEDALSGACAMLESAIRGLLTSSPR